MCKRQSFKDGDKYSYDVITGMSAGQSLATKVHNNLKKSEYSTPYMVLLSTDIILILDYEILFSDFFDLKNEE